MSAISNEQPLTTDKQPLTTEAELVHIKETITMLCLAVCQIEASVSESNKSVNELTESFTGLAAHTREVDSHISSDLDADSFASIKQQMQNTSREMQSKINQAITAFQFYDRISQRLDHVARSLEKVSDIIRDDNNINNPDIWRSIQQEVKGSYTMEAERLMYEQIMRGAGVREALEVYRHHFSTEKVEENNDDEIELF